MFLNEGNFVGCWNLGVAAEQARASNLMTAANKTTPFFFLARNLIAHYCECCKMDLTVMSEPVCIMQNFHAKMLMNVQYRSHQACTVQSVITSCVSMRLALNRDMRRRWQVRSS